MIENENHRNKKRINTHEEEEEKQTKGIFRTNFKENRCAQTKANISIRFVICL